MRRLLLTSKFDVVGEKLLSLVPSSRGKKVAFIHTAADVYDTRPWMEVERAKLVELGFDVEDYDIKGKDEEHIRAELKNVDIIFVAGGNCFYLLAFQHSYSRSPYLDLE